MVGRRGITAQPLCVAPLSLYNAFQVSSCTARRKSGDLLQGFSASPLNPPKISALCREIPEVTPPRKHFRFQLPLVVGAATTRMCTRVTPRALGGGGRIPRWEMTPSPPDVRCLIYIKQHYRFLLKYRVAVWISKHPPLEAEYSDMLRLGAEVKQNLRGSSALKLYKSALQHTV